MTETPPHDGNERGKTMSAVGIHPMHVDSGSIRSGPFISKDLASSGQNGIDDFGETVYLIGSQRKIQMRDGTQQLRTAALRHAAHDPENHVRFLFFQPLQDPQFSDGLALRLIPDTAGVQDHEIGTFFRIRGDMPFRLQKRGGGIGIPLVHLTSVCFDIELHFKMTSEFR